MIKHIIYVFHNIFSEYYSPSSKPNYIFDTIYLNYIFGYFSSIFDLIYFFFFFYQTFTQHSTNTFPPDFLYWPARSRFIIGVTESALRAVYGK